MQRRTLQKEVAKMPPLPKSEPPLNDPPYEVIEFPSQSSQQYSNTSLLFGNKAAQNKKEEVNRKCDLCGSTNAQYHCEMCVQQAFCVSCDQMYHRHPKRQNHIRKRLPSAAVKSKGTWQPPVPPKGESLMAPIPPPRRNKKAPKNVVGSQPQESLKKNGSIMGSLKRFVGGIQPVSSPFQPKTTRNDSRPPKFAHSLHSAEFDRQSLRRDGGYLGWELQDRHRSGSVAALNGPGFSPMIQAQSMAQLNCPSCHHHGGPGGIGGVSGWDWNRSQMNLNAPFQQAWPGMQTGTWHGSIMFPPAGPAGYRMPGENFSDHSSSRRGSIRHQRYDRRRANKFDNEDDSESDVSLSDDRKSRREASPALSRRSRRTMASDSEDDALSRKSDRRFKQRRVPMSRDPSPAMFRPPKATGYRSKKFANDDDDDDAISVKSSRSRRSRRSPISLKSASQTAYLKKNQARCSSSDSDDELTSERDGLREGRNAMTPSDSADEDEDHVPPPARVQSPKRVPKMSHITKAASTLKTKVAERVKNYEKMQIKGNVSKGSGKETTNNDEEDDDWECEHCTYLNPASARVCDVCCKSKKKPVTDAEPNSATEQIVESMKALDVSSAADTANVTSPTIVGHKKKGDESSNKKETVSTSKTSTGTSPPPQSAATQTYEVPSVVNKRNRSLSFDDYSDWNPNKKSSSAASIISDTNQSIPLQSKQEMSPEASQSPVIMDAVLQKQMKDSLEIVKLLKDAEKHQFTPDDLTVALLHCGENSPVKWLLENWTQMIDTVVTLATNFGHEQPENTIGTISCHEARSALHLHNGDLWAAATECIRQRQRKYAKLMAQGNFSREDVVTVLTANHGDIEAAYMELRKSQLKPFLMKIWGPPQGLDNDSGNIVRLSDIEKYHTHEPRRYSSLPKNIPNSAQNNFNFVHSWLQSIHTANPEDTDSADFAKLKDNLRRHASAFYINTNLGGGNSFASEEYSDSNDELYSMALPYEAYLRYRSCENLNINKRPKASTMGKRFHKSSESLFYNRTKSEPRGEFYLPHSAHCASKMSHVDLINKLYENCDDDGETRESDRFSESENFEDVEASVQHSSKDYYNLKIDSSLELSPGLGLAENRNLPAQKTNSVSSQEEHVVETDSLEGSVHESASSENLGEEFAKNPIYVNETDETTRKTVVPLSTPLDPIPSVSASELTIFQTPPEPTKFNRNEENSTSKLEESKNSPLFDEVKALYELAKLNLEFLIISNNDASVEVENSALSTHQRPDNVIDTVIEPEPVPDVAKIVPEIPTNYLSKAYIELGPSSSSFRDNQIDKNDPAIDPSISDDVPLPNENYQSDSDDNFVDVDTKESTESNFISENSSDDDQSFIEEEEEEENEHIDKVFHDVLAENIKEYIEQEAALAESIKEDIEREAAPIEKKADIVADQLELVSPVVLNPPIKPVHIIRINVPDLINTSKIIDPDIQSQNPISSLDKNDLRETENNFEPREDPTADDKSHTISSNTRINLVENETNEKEPKINDKAADEVTAENPSLPDVSKNDNFSEYIREIVITQPNDYVDDKIVEENQRQEQSSPIQNGYETDSSDHSSIVKQFNNIAQETASDIGEITKEEERQKERTQDGYLSDASDSSFKVEVENCLTQGLSNYDQAVLAAQLIKLKFDRSQSIDAASECSTIQAAITYLQQDCQLCAEKVSIKQMISMLECEHRCCQSCAQQFFSLQILEKSIVDCVCPFCKKPKISELDSDEMSLYFSNLDILLKTILQPNVHELFQQKLRDRTLMQDPNFKWCIKCSSGFIADPDQRRVFCPDCNSVSCAQCGKLWDKEHDGKTCEQYNSWLSKNNVGSQLSRYLEDFGVTCPKCDTKFILVKGGCMHLTCSNCKYEFCSDCMKPFAMGTDCKVSDYCIKLGLHAHHPRNCLFYLRDKEPQELKQLLKDNNVPLDLTPKENPRCDVPLQKETEEGLIDTRCGARVEEAGLCRNHLREHLSRIICRLKLETIDILTCDDLETIVNREGKKRPPRGYHTPEKEYYKALYQLDDFLKRHRVCVILRRTHFIEYLTALIKKHKIDPIVIFDLAEILQEFRRRGKSLPIRAAKMLEYEYRRSCIKVILEEIPLE